jgi:uncharacterized protein YjiK
MRLRFVALTALFLGCASSGSDATQDDAALKEQSNATLPLREVSGLAGRAGHFVAVGDRSSTVVTFRMHNGDITDAVKHNALPEAGKNGSQYEAVTYDAKGNIVVLSERGEIIVLAANADFEESTSELDWDSVNAFVDGHVNSNSLGEGLVVLSNSHILVALEKSPSALVEFGPKGDAAIGFPGSTSTAAFAPGKTLVALTAWKVEDKDAADLSEISVGPDGALWALSQQSEKIVRFERTLRPSEERASVKASYSLPSSIVGAEGLVFDGNKPMVARDRSAKSKNLFVLDPIAL